MLINGPTETNGISSRQAFRTAELIDSVLCLGRMGDNPIESWKNQIQWYPENNYFSELNRIDGKPMEFEWNIFLRNTTVGILKERTSQARSSSCQCSMTSYERRKKMKKCEENSRKVREHAQRFPRGHWSFHELVSEKKWYGTCRGRSNGSWDRTAERMLENCQRTGHPIFRCTSVFERRQFKAQEEEGQQYTSQHVMNCRSILSISSVFTEL